VQAIRGLIASVIFVVLFYVFMIFVLVPFLRNKVLKRFLPAPGQGPSEESRRKGWFISTTYAKVGNKVVKATIRGGDPGYGDTAKMVTAAALCLALHRDELPAKNIGGGGILTPASAFGNVLVDRLKEAGLAIDVGLEK